MPLIHEDFIRCKCSDPWFSVTAYGVISKVTLTVGYDDQPVILDDIHYKYTCQRCGAIYTTRRELIDLAESQGA